MVSWGRKALKSKRVAAGVQKKAARVEAFAKSISPVFDSGRDKRAAPPVGAPGEYRDAWHTTDMSGADGPRARVSNEDHLAGKIEFGWGKHIHPFAILSKTKAKFR
jgi:hypothetical protein